jgi:hypothetical protein
MRPYLENTQYKKGDGGWWSGTRVEQLPSKYEALSSNSSTAQKQKEGRKKIEWQINRNVEINIAHAEA